MILRKDIEKEIINLIKDKLNEEINFEGQELMSKSFIELGISSLDSIEILIQRVIKK